MKSQATDEKIRIMRIIARLNIGGPAIHTILLSSNMQTFGNETLLVAGQVATGEGKMAYLAKADGIGLRPDIVHTPNGQSLCRSVHPAKERLGCTGADH